MYLPTLMEKECALSLLGEESGMDKLLSKVRDLVEEHEVMMNHYHCYKVCVLLLLSVPFLLIILLLGGGGC